LSDRERSDLLEHERVKRSHTAIDRSPEHQRALANANAENAAA
jgi:hypothetical protein